MLRLGVLGSGSGTNLQAILNAIEWGGLKVEVVCVLSDVEDAFILERARNHEVSEYVVDCGPSRSKLEGAAEQRVLELLMEHNADAVALAGFMRIVKKPIIEAFPGRVLNIHPSLLPAFPGLNACKQALEYGARFSGCTVHFVDSGVDTGPIILQKSVPVLPQDTLQTLQERVHEQEHIAYPEALQLLAEDRLTIEGRLVRIKPAPETSVLR